MLLLLRPLFAACVSTMENLIIHSLIFVIIIKINLKMRYEMCCVCEIHTYYGENVKYLINIFVLITCYNEVLDILGQIKHVLKFHLLKFHGFLLFKYGN